MCDPHHVVKSDITFFYPVMNGDIISNLKYTSVSFQHLIDLTQKDILAVGEPEKAITRICHI